MGFGGGIIDHFVSMACAAARVNLRISRNDVGAPW